MLHVDNLSVNILKNIRFSLPRGEHLTILGANGSGKTTLARALCGLLPSDALTYGGRRLASLSPQERSETVHFIPARLHVYDDYLTVWDYLALNSPAGEEEMGDVLESLGISALKHAPCTRLSSGESALLMTAGAMIRKARYTIFDEPTANLDPRNAVKLYRFLKGYGGFEHRIVITHDLNLAYRLHSTILFLDGGEERFYGDCAAFFSPDNLERCFGNSLACAGGHYMVNYDETL